MLLNLTRNNTQVAVINMAMRRVAVKQKHKQKQKQKTNKQKRDISYSLTFVTFEHTSLVVTVENKRTTEFKFKMSN